LTQYVDTSILAAYYCPEPLSERAEQRLRELRPPTISWLTSVELHSALAKKVRMNELAEEDAEQIHDLFRSHVTRELYDIVGVERADFVQARRWMTRLETALRTLDALHLAVACRRDLVLLTSDQGLAEAGRTFDVEVELMSAANSS
jgi:predicted nucleic acid-binding protein